MGLHGAAALIPKHKRQARGIPENFPQGGALFRPGTQGAVHILGVAQHQALHPMLGDEGPDLRHNLLLAAGMDDRGEPGQGLQAVGDGDACVGVAIVNGHNFMDRSFQKPL